MSIAEYQKLIAQNGFEEYPLLNDGKKLLSKFMVYGEMDLDLKTYLSQLILCRSFYGTYTAWFADVEWFTENFFAELHQDYAKPHLTNTIRFASNMILKGDAFTAGIIGTTFMFGVLEFYAKHKLGFRPMDYDFFDKKGKKEYILPLSIDNKNMDLSIKSAFEQLQLTKLPVANALNEIDDFTIARLTRAGVPSERWHVHRIAERLHLARNPMLHGESHSFYSVGSYLLMLYTLFHLYELKENG